MGPKAPKAKPSEERTGSSISSRETRCYVGGRQARHRRKGRKASMYVSTCIASGNCRPPRARSVGGPSDAFRQPTLLFSSPPRGRTRKSFTLCPFLLPSHPPSLESLRCENPRNKQWEWSQLYGQVCPLLSVLRVSNTVSNGESEPRKIGESKGFNLVILFDIFLSQRVNYQTR